MMTHLCRSVECGKRLAREVNFCPYCGISQAELPSRAHKPRPLRAERAQSLSKSKLSDIYDRAAASTDQQAILRGDKPCDEMSHGQSGVTAPDQAPKNGAKDSGSDRDEQINDSSVTRREKGSRRRTYARAFVVVLLCLVVLMATTALLSPRHAAVPSLAAVDESEFACSDQVDASIVVVLDLRAPHDDATRQEVSARIGEHLRAGGPGVRRLTVFSTLQGGKLAAVPVVSFCSIAPDSYRLARWLAGEKPEMQRALTKALDDAVRVEQSNAARIPVSRTLADISVTQYLRAQRNTLMVFSDLLEDSARFNLRHCDSGETAVGSFREMRRGALERPQFGNTYVSLNLAPVLGVPSKTLDCRTHFWRWFFGDIEGPQAGLNFSYLPGGAELDATKEERTK